MARERKFSTEELFHATKKLLLASGYEGFTFSLLADNLGISRGTIYKYFDNKEELITEYMLFEMKQFLTKLKKIDSHEGFDVQFEFLLDLIFEDPDIHKLIEIGQHLKISKKIRELDHLHLEMYSSLQNFIQLGKDKKRLKPHLPDGLILGFIFQSIAIPNHFGVPYREWVHSIKEIMKDGLLLNNN